MNSKPNYVQNTQVKILSKKFIYWAIAIFSLKLIIILNIPFGAWFAADGENYVEGVNGLLNEGIFSKQHELIYWPAGYPIFIYSLKIFGTSWLTATLSIIQSGIFSFSAYYFAKSMLFTKVKNYAFFILILILINPTLSLSSMSIGYESLAASGYLLILSIAINNLTKKDNSGFISDLVFVSLIVSFLGFIQPRLILGGVLIILIWILSIKSIKNIFIYLIISILLVLIFPSSLLLRNNESMGLTTISTNLGVTMDIGAGDRASGGYDSKFHGVPCELGTLNEVDADQARIKCVLNWYIKNPVQASKIFWNKSVYFWSPWFGPLGNGTMARNPWLKINPVKGFFDSSQAGKQIVLGPVGKFFSWFWMISGLVLFFYGFAILWKSRGIERLIAKMALAIVASSWFITLLSIGDHRFRLPIMGMSLFLQAVGIRTLLKGGKSQMVDGPGLR